MQIRISSTDFTEVIMENNFPESYHDVSNALTDRTTPMEIEICNGAYREIFFEGMHISYGDMRMKDEVHLMFESDYETVEMHFDLCGNTSTKIDGSANQPIEFSTNRHNIVYTPPIKGAIRFRADSMRMLEINLVPARFEKYFEDTDSYTAFFEAIRNHRPALMAKHNMPITPAMMHIINDILNCTKTGMFKRLFLESRVLDLLLLQLEQFATHDCMVFCSLKPTDVDKMYHAKEIILKQFHNPCSLIDLARQIGSNEFTLKKGFKEVFGTTVFGMLADVKMEEAKRLLLSGEKNISEISDLSGYKNQAHFTKAFKRKFGVPPSGYVLLKR